MENIFINKKLWNTFTDDQIEDFVQSCFKYYRNNGFPFYNLSESQILKIFDKLKNFDSNTILLETNTIRQVMHGLNLANHFMPHLYKTKSNNFKSPFESFSDDDMLYMAIRKRIKYGDNMSDAGMRKIFSWVTGTQKVSNFRPTVAKYIYDNYAKNGNVLDYSSGYGGRLIGAISSDKVVKYTGVEPCTETYNKLLEIAKYTDKEINIINEPFEDVIITEKFDLSFSSPPYFNTEEYDYTNKQSFMRYKTKIEWKNKFLTPLIENNYNCIKNDGYFIINIANVKTYQNLVDDTLEISKKTGFKLIKTYQMALSSLMKTGFKYEPIFVFAK